MPIIKYSSNLKPHARQRELRECPARFVVACCGRRFGKTMIAMDKFASEICNNPNGENALYWWCAPTYARAGKAFDLFVSKFRAIVNPLKTRRNDFLITFTNGVVAEFVSLEKWENRKGDGLDGCIVDEAARCSSRAWTELIRPALADKKGWAWLIGTPVGRNWFHKEWLRGQDKKIQTDAAGNALYASFRFPSSDNPFLDPAEIKENRRVLPEDQFEQEFEAKFMEEGAGVFRGLALCKANSEEIYRNWVCVRPAFPDEVCTLGVDLGKHQDYTVLTVLAQSGNRRPRLIYGEQFNKMDWLSQQLRITEVGRTYNAVIWMDVSGPGDRMFEDLVRAGLRVEPVKFVSATVRAELLKTLQVEIANGRLALPEEPLELFLPMWSQLQNFEYHVSPAGNLLMAPPDGEHDDWVMSLGCAVMGAIRVSGRADLTSFSAEAQLKMKQELASNPSALSNMLGLAFGGMPESRFGDVSSPFRDLPGLDGRGAPKSFF